MPSSDGSEEDEEEDEEPAPQRRSRSVSLRPPTAPSSLGGGFTRSSSRDLPPALHHYSLFSSAPAPPLFVDPKQQVGCSAAGGQLRLRLEGGWSASCCRALVVSGGTCAAAASRSWP
jgi:hypothetical protein